MEEDQFYWHRRASEERQAALTAASDEVRRRHLELADLLARRVPAQARGTG